MEVLRGIGCMNEQMHFDAFHRVLEYGNSQPQTDLILATHETDNPLNFDLVVQLRRVDDAGLAETPIILLSSNSTRSMIEAARDSGIDEVVMRPISPLQLRRKMRQLIELPRDFVTSTNYVGPCRRRKRSEFYAGPRRRITDFEKDLDRDVPIATGADELAVAVSELREACGKLSDERLGLVARVRQTADRTAVLARKSGDLPLERTAAAVKLYLDGVGSQNLLETHVLETGINALTQLAVLPDAYHEARQSVASLMTIAVRKKLLLYKQRKLGDDDETSKLLSQIGGGTHAAIDIDDQPNKAKA